MSLPTDQRVGPYEIDGELGRGGMGVVYRGRDAGGRAVAIKRIAVRDDELARRLLREADVRISHRNVVRVLGSGLDDRGEPYVVTELLEGESLQDRMTRDRANGVLDLAAILDLFAQAADGLAAIHAAGIVHRDIKPSNLFVTTDGTLKVLDFGTAAFSDASTILTAAGAMVGTPAYLSMEQARGAAVDARSDLWSLGMSLYHALSGELPFRRSTVLASALAVQTDPLPSLLLHAPTVPLELAELVEHCLARKPADRPQSATELARLLRAIPTEGTGRPSQALLARADETWRPVAIVLIDEGGDRAHLESQAAARGGVTFPLFARSAVIVFGAASSRGDELERAIEFALACAEEHRSVVVGDGRARSGGRELDSESLRAVSELLARKRSGVSLTLRAAAFVGGHVELERHEDGSARVLGVRPPAPAPAIPLIGRDRELAALEDAARRASSGAFERVEIVGETGMGKTALMRAFLERLPSIAPGAVAVSARARDTDTAPYAALLEALDAHVPEAIAPQDALDRRRVASIDGIGEQLVSASLVVIVVEDVHHADPHTAALLVDLRALFEDRPLLLVTTARGAPSLTTDVGEIVRLSLGPLGSTPIATLVERILGGEAARRVAVELAARAGGNPLFAVHLAQLASARGELSSVDAWNIPVTVESAVQSRLDALPPELRGATHTMAVLGTEGTLAEARWALGSRSDGWIAGLTAAGVLEPMRRVDRTGWQFESRIVAEVARAALDDATAARLHREIAARLAHACDSRSAGAPHPDVVLRHADLGGDEALSQRFVGEAFARAARTGDGRRVLELLPRARQSGAIFPIAIAAAEAAAFVGDGVGVEALLRDALAHATTPDERALARAELGERARRESRLSEARDQLERAITETTSPAIAMRTRCRLALVLVSEGEALAALHLLATDETHALPVAVRALLADTEGYVHGASGALGPRRDAYERAARLYAEIGDARREAGANGNLGDTLRQMGDLAAAQVALRRAIDGARRVGNGLTEAYASTNLAATLTAIGRTREALATLDLAASRARTVGDRRLELVIALHRARAEKRAPSDAELERVRARDDATLSAMALAVVLEHGHPTDAQLDEALALLERFDELEEGALELGRVLYARRPTERIRRLVIDRLDWTDRTLDREEWRARFVEHVASGYAEVAAPWLAARRS